MSKAIDLVFKARRRACGINENLMDLSLCLSFINNLYQYMPPAPTAFHSHAFMICILLQ